MEYILKVDSFKTGLKTLVGFFISKDCDFLALWHFVFSLIKRMQGSKGAGSVLCSCLKV